jgi:hypothetical protein
MVTSDSVSREKCRCDGQFSAYVECRNSNSSFYHFQPQQLGLNPRLHNEANHQIESCLREYAWHGGPQGFNNSAGVACSHKDSRGMLLILQGGLHFKSITNQTLTHFLPIWKHPVVKTCATYKNLIVVWCSFNTHSPLRVKNIPTSRALKWESILTSKCKRCLIATDWRAYQLLTG